MQKQQILEQIACLFNDEGVPVRERLFAGKILLAEAEAEATGAAERAEKAMAALMAAPVPDPLMPAVEAIEQVFPPGSEGTLAELLDKIPSEVAEGTNKNKLAAALRGRGWLTRKVRGATIWKR